MSIARQNYHEDCEAAVNKQINLYLYAAYVLKSIKWHCQREDVFYGIGGYGSSLPEFFEQRADMLCEYQNRRGGRIVLQDIRKPEIIEYDSCPHAFHSILDILKHVNESTLALINIANVHGDPDLEHHLSVNHISAMTDLLSLAAKHLNMSEAAVNVADQLAIEEHLDLSAIIS